MKRALFALAMGAAVLGSGHAEARLDLAGIQCTEPNLAPAERVKYCALYADEGSGGEAGTAGRRFLLAEAYRLAGRYADAEAILTATLNLFPKSEPFLNERAQVYAQDGKYDLALADANKAVGLAPKDDARDKATDLNARCWVRAIAGKELDAAIADCEAALLLHPADPPMMDSLAFAHYRRGDLQKALDGYDAALNASPRQWPSLYMRGIVKLRAGDAGGGKDDVTTALAHAPYIGDEFAGYGVDQPNDKGELP
ncbi:MAG TPA: hypothetical protein VHU87_11960 [Rhizomicrobium sp.]|jgi:tetratricopeptide (TPR) repeat protein|nr:hypothetical protein [Rhizomicrobium sp.]